MGLLNVVVSGTEGGGVRACQTGLLTTRWLVRGVGVGVGRGGVRAGVLVDSRPGPCFVSWVKCQVVFWAAGVRLLAFLPEVSAGSVIAGMGA